jgi:VWFA-related protein
MKQVVPLLVLAATFASAQDQRPTVRTATAGVLIDVTVLDKDGRPITDLTGADFEISEDGKLQQIVSATLMRGGLPTHINAAAAAQASSGRPTDGSAAPASSPTPTPTVTAILFDSLSSDARPFATKAAAQFISTLSSPNEYAGVFESGLAMTTVLPFTNHAADLRAAIDHVANTPTDNLSAEAERKRAITRTQGLDPATPVTTGAEESRGWTTLAEYEQRLYVPGGRGADPREALLTRMALRMQDGYSRFLNEYEGDGSLAGLRSAVAALAPLSGRKSVLYFTEELPITSRLKPRFDSLISEANRANVTVYVVDAAGLRVNSKEAETSRGVNVAGAQGVGDVSRDGAFTKDLEKQEQMLSSRPAAALGRLANETGGFLIDNTNDLGKGVARMQSERTTYYLLGYQPTNTALDGKFRKVTVKVKRGKYIVRARTGYIAPR